MSKELPSFDTTNALMVCPRVSSGMPMTAAPRNFPLWKSTSSTSVGLMRNPLDLIIVSRRPMKYRKPSSSIFTGRPNSKPFRSHPVRAATADLAEGMSCVFRPVPIAERNRRPAMHKFTRLARFAKVTLFVEHKNFSVWNGFAHRSGPPIEFFRRKVSRTKGFGEPVHQKHFRCGKHFSQHFEHRLRHCAARIRDVAQVRHRLLGET